MMYSVYTCNIQPITLYLLPISIPTTVCSYSYMYMYMYIYTCTFIYCTARWYIVPFASAPAVAGCARRRSASLPRIGSPSGGEPPGLIGSLRVGGEGAGLDYGVRLKGEINIRLHYVR